MCSGGAIGYERISYGITHAMPNLGIAMLFWIQKNAMDGQ